MSQSERNLLFVTTADLSGTSGNNVATLHFVTKFGQLFDGNLVVVCPEPHAEYTDEVVQNVDKFYQFKRSQTKSLINHVKTSIKIFAQTRRAIAESNPTILIGRMAPLFWAPPLLARRHNIPYVLLSRGTTYKRLKFSSVLTQIYKLNVRIADHVYVASEEIQRDTEKLQKGGNSLTTLLPNGVDPELFQASPKNEVRKQINGELSSSDFVIGFVGSMSPRHCVEELFGSITQLPSNINPKLLLVGDGPKMDVYQNSARRYGITDRIVFTGVVPHEQVPHYVSACDIAYGVTTQDSATPLKCFEYLACERPIIVRDIPELEFVETKNLGRSVEQISPDHIADAIKELYELPESERGEMGQRGRELILNHYSWDRIVEVVLNDFVTTSR